MVNHYYFINKPIDEDIVIKKDGEEDVTKRIRILEFVKMTKFPDESKNNNVNLRINEAYLQNIIEKIYKQSNNSVVFPDIILSPNKNSSYILNTTIMNKYSNQNDYLEYLFNGLFNGLTNYDSEWLITCKQGLLDNCIDDGQNLTFNLFELETIDKYFKFDTVQLRASNNINMLETFMNNVNNNYICSFIPFLIIMILLYLTCNLIKLIPKIKK